MKRFLCLCLTWSLVLGLLPAVALAIAETPADLGWGTDGNTFAGWTVSDGRITGNYVDGAYRIWHTLEDASNFKISADITCDNTTSPFISLGGTVVELDANGGNGNQVYPKINSVGSDWMNADGCQVHVEINRVGGGYLTIVLTGSGNAETKLLTAACGDVTSIEIGMYRGGFISIANFSVEAADESIVGDDPNAGAGELNVEISDRDSDVWELGTNWAVDPEDRFLIMTQAGGGTTQWKKTLDMSKSFTFSMDWVVNTIINSNNSWAEKLGICLKDAATGDYLFIRLQRYRSGGGMYQVHIGAQWWTAATASWSANVLDVWCSKTSGGVLRNMKVIIVRDTSQDAIQIKIVDNEDCSSLGSATLKANNFSDAAIQNRFSETILHGTALGVMISCDGNNASYYLTDPVLGEVEKVVSQNLFTCDDVWKPELDKEGNICFTTQNTGFGWMEYNTGLDTLAGLDFTYTVTVSDYGTSGASNVIRLRYGESPEAYFFARILFRDGEFSLREQLWTGDWMDLLYMDFQPCSVADDIWQVHVIADYGQLTLEIQDSSGTVLGRASTDALPTEFFSCQTLELMFCAEGNGLYSLSDFRGLPEIYTGDRRNEPFTRVVFAGDLANGWTDRLINDIAAYQNSVPKAMSAPWDPNAILQKNGNLIILADGMEALRDGVPTESYVEALRTLIAELKKNCSAGTVLLVTGIPYLKGADVGLCAAYNTAIRAVAAEHSVLFANIYRAQSQTYWTMDQALHFSVTGELVVAGEILQELLRSCSCLAVNATTDLNISAAAPAEKTERALEAFRIAADAQSMRSAVEDAHLGADLDLYLGFSSGVQTALIEALLATNRDSIDSFAAADAMINTLAMQIGLEHPRSVVTGAPFGIYVAVGDSISVGETSVNKATDGWVPLLASLISQAQNQNITLINKAISGTRMCTITDNKMFPAAKETVQEYIVDNHPDLISISYGINDLHAGTSLEEFITTYRAYLAEVVAGCPNAVIMVCGLSAKGGDADSGTLQTWNAAIKSLAEEFSLIFNDSYSDTRGVEWLLSDGLHPSNAGYRVMANAALRTLSAHVNLGGQPDVQPPVADNPTEPVCPADPVTPVPAGAIAAGITIALAAATTAVLLIFRKRNAKKAKD